MSARIAVIQPIEGENSHERIVSRGLEMAAKAADEGARFLCFPERFAAIGLKDRSLQEQAQHSHEVVERCRTLATDHNAAVILPSIELGGDRVYNTSWVITPDGLEKYRKVHLTLNEREAKKLTAGDQLPVFTFAGVTFGVLTCYDLYFPEAARVLALRGAAVIFVPSHQRAETAELIAVQVRSRAFDNCVYVARAAYGHEQGTVWRPGMPAGASSITDWEGRMVRDLGVREGYATAEVASSGPPPRLRSFEGRPDEPRRYLFDDRRPDVYQELCDVG